MTGDPRCRTQSDPSRQESRARSALPRRIARYTVGLSGTPLHGTFRYARKARRTGMAAGSAGAVTPLLSKMTPREQSSRSVAMLHAQRAAVLAQVSTELTTPNGGRRSVWVGEYWLRDPWSGRPIPRGSVSLPRCTGRTPACGRAALVDARVSRVSRPPGDGACPARRLRRTEPDLQRFVAPMACHGAYPPRHAIIPGRRMTLFVRANACGGGRRRTVCRCPSQMLGMARRGTSGMSFRRDVPGRRQGRHVLDG